MVELDAVKWKATLLQEQWRADRISVRTEIPLLLPSPAKWVKCSTASPGVHVLVHTVVRGDRGLRIAMTS